MYRLLDTLYRALMGEHTLPAGLVWHGGWVLLGDDSGPK